MKQLFLSLITLLMFSSFLSGCTISTEDPTIEDETIEPDGPLTTIDKYGIYHVPTSDTPTIAFGDASAGIRDHVLPALAVQQNKEASGNIISAFIDPVFAVHYYDDANFIGISEATIHVGNQKYSAFNLPFDDSIFGVEIYIASDDAIKGAGDIESGTITINNTPFGIYLSSMISVEWQLNKIVAEGLPTDNEHGYMMTGIETYGVGIPKTGADITFMGAGKGKYDAVNRDVHFTTFGVTANVDFATRSIKLDTSNTKNADDEVLAYLDFNSTLIYEAGVNNISGTVDVNTMSGFIDARFYSARNNDKQATELGGTFAMRNDDDASYIGMFGLAETKPDVIINPPVVITPPPVVTDPPVDTSILQVATSGAPTAINKTHSIFISTALTNDRSHTESLTLSALAVQQNDDDGSKTLSNIISPILALTFDGSDDSIDDVTLYAGNNQYLATNLLNINREGFHGDISNASDYDSAKITIDRKSFFNFDVRTKFEYDDILYVEWELTKDAQTEDGVTISEAKTEHGYMIAGNEANKAQMNNALGKPTFTGFGKGRYDANGVIYFPEFEVTAKVNFPSNSIELITSDTSAMKDGNKVDLSYLNFTSTLTHEEGVNNIGGIVSSNGMAGNVDARYYTTQYQNLELGGTFAMRNNTSSYIGAFATSGSHHGIQQSLVTLPGVFTPRGDGTSPVANGIRNITTIWEPATDTLSFPFDTAASIALGGGLSEHTMKALAVQQNDDDGDKTVSNILSPILGLTFGDGNGGYAIYDVTLYVGASQYEVPELSDENADFTLREGFMGAITNTPSYDTATVIVDRLTIIDAERTTNFEYNNLVYAQWTLIKTAKTEHGYMIAGNETGTAQLSAQNGTAIFNGYGKGRYDNNGDIYLPEFNLTATIDFDSYNIALTTRNTSAVKDGNAVALPQLNFTSALTYKAGVNDINGNTGINGMVGIVDARFYSVAGDPLELGGTFAMRNNQGLSYIGAFGASATYYNPTDTRGNSFTPPPPPVDYHISTIQTTDAPALDSGNLLANLDAFESTYNSGNNNTTYDYIYAALAVQQDYHASYSRDSETDAWGSPDSETNVIAKIAESVISMNYKSPGKGGMRPVFYIGGNEYDVQNFSNGEKVGEVTISEAFKYIKKYDSDSNVAIKAEITGTEIYDSARFVIDFEPFGLLLYHSIYVEWGLVSERGNSGTSDTETTQHGYMVTGNEMRGQDIPTENTGNFTGGGNGRYADTGTITSTKFGVTANVDFENRNITFTASDTKNISDDVPLTNLDFTSTLTYDAGTNNIKGNVSVDNMAGTMDARFYRQIGYGNVNIPIDSGRATELGGTFSMKNGDKSYIGAFITSNK